jgi:hypothetical protein
VQAAADFDWQHAGVAHAVFSQHADLGQHLAVAQHLAASPHAGFSQALSQHF